MAASGVTERGERTLINSTWVAVKKLLVLRLDNIGDVIMTSPVLQALKQNLPQVHLTLLASPGGSLAAPLLPWIDQVIPWRTLWQDLGSLDFNPDREWQLIKTLANEQFDAAIILTSFSQSPHPAALVCQLAGIPLRLGESKETGGEVLTHEITSAPDQLHQVDRNLRLIESVGFEVSERSLMISIPATAQQSINQLLKTHGLGIDTPYLLLNPRTSCPSRNYEPLRFAIAADRLAQITGYPVLVTGVENDRKSCEQLLEILGDRGIDLIGKTNLSELAALVSRASLLLSNNTSTMHLADATGTPSVILFAGTELEGQWQPRSCPLRLLRRPTPCSPCYAFTCRYELECLDIEPEEVVAAGLELLRQR
uniref:Glycosyl transferase family 9 n=1 Tax=Cyanothece sp. (strain PCC 7425 / ATCC 29141) TaxID=395961 RepID=B8HNV5_CYAP4